VDTIETKLFQATLLLEHRDCQASEEVTGQVHPKRFILLLMFSLLCEAVSSYAECGAGSIRDDVKRSYSGATHVLYRHSAGGTAINHEKLPISSLHWNRVLSAYEPRWVTARLVKADPLTLREAEVSCRRH
jgi:hypothetical protein